MQSNVSHHATHLFAHRPDLRSSRSLKAMGCLFILGLLGSPNVFGQSTDEEEKADSLRSLYGSGIGFEVVVTNSGFGLGGYYLTALNETYSFLAEVTMGSEKSEREVKFFGLGQSFIPDKANYFLRMPMRIGVQKRLRQEYIEDNFRPYLQFTTGPTLGWVYPYFDDENGNEMYDREERRYDGIGSIFKGEFRFGLGGVVGIGAHFGENTRLTQGVRIAYSFNYFFEPVQLLETAEQIEPARYFGSPSISITFGRLF
jgi:hypothetical protein